MPEIVLSFDEALAAVLTQARGVAAPALSETATLLDSVGRTLAEPVIAERDQPPFDRSTRDGFAVRATDLSAVRPLKVVGSIRAGERWRGKPVGEGEAIEIMTGAPLPEGADAVLMIEHSVVSAEGLRLAEGRTLAAHANVVPRGAEARAGDTLLPIGRVINAAEIAVAASCGCAELRVFAEPRVAIVATGDELVELEAPLEAWQIRNSNSYALAALVKEEGGQPERLPIARDTMDDLRKRISDGRETDLLLLSGGVSMGKFDLVEQVLDEFGAQFVFTGALIQPGKPIVFGRIPRADGRWTPFFGLPGNPVSTQVCFHLFVAPLLHALAGRTSIGPRFVEATLGEDVQGGTRMTRFLPAEVSGTWERVSVHAVGWQGSGDVTANARGNAYVVLPAGVDAFCAGETVRVLLR